MERRYLQREGVATISANPGATGQDFQEGQEVGEGRGEEGKGNRGRVPPRGVSIVSVCNWGGRTLWEENSDLPNFTP